MAAMALALCVEGEVMVREGDVGMFRGMYGPASRGMDRSLACILDLSERYRCVV